MSGPIITFLEVEKEDESKIKDVFPHAHISETVLSSEEIVKQFPDTEILCVFIYAKVDQKVIENLPNLKLIITRSVGYDHIDLKAADERNIPVCNVPDYGSHVIAEHVFALLLSTIRCVQKGDERVEKHCEFDFHGLRGVALKGKTLGLIGTGKIGKNVARIASMGFLMNVLAYDVHPDEDAAHECHFQYTESLDEIWEKADILSLHVPLLTDTKHLINEKSLRKMKQGTILINTARGGLIHTKALVQAIKSGKIAYAALDVLEHERNIEEDRSLIDLPQVVTTPHIAFYADDSMQCMYEESFATINRFIKDEELIHKVAGL